MGILSETLRYVCRNSFCMKSSLLYASRRGYINDNNLSLLLQRRDGDGICCFTPLSTEEGKNFYPPFVPSLARKRVKNSISCNGLLFLDYAGGDCVVWNPSTDDYQVLPLRSPYVDAFDYYVDCYAGCFGFDPRCNDYKMLRFCVKYNTEINVCKPGWKEEHVEVYSLMNDLWKKLPVPEIAFPTHFNSSVLINGYYYWLCRNPVWSGAIHIHILRYDIANEEFTLLPLPDIGSNLLGGYHLELLELDGLLSAVVYPRLGIEKRFQVWVMMNGSWVMESAPINLSVAERPLGFWKNRMFFQGFNHELIEFDRVTGDLNNLGIYDYLDRKQGTIHGEPLRTMKLFSYLNNPTPFSDQD